jgi:ribonuclease R
MLPNALSDKLCSLQPNVDRLCFAADMTISGSGQLRAAKFYPAVMRSHARLTYGQAHEVLFERKTAAIAALGPLAARLEPLLGVYHALAKSRRRRGALDFDSTEAIFEFNEAQGVRAIKSYPRNDAHRLIEECMIMANVAVAAELREQRVPTLFRVHGQPEARKIDLLTTVLATLGIAADLPEDRNRAICVRSRKARQARGARLRRIAGGACDAAGACTSRPTSATSGSRSPSIRISPRRSAAIRISSCIAR